MTMETLIRSKPRELGTGAFRGAVIEELPAGGVPASQVQRTIEGADR
jgi:hypothetical protein